ncbi:ComF family protein [Hoyosella sp. YIM 151337]|uniref:ComF family protein n=1 Tax=Hoyosella sp. YIM 151337 TaxID=2992742 RepID=UPI0022360BA8|nr:ComF family protein [Hoyosella sp. YIM 151337]MCW4352300.1 ComF family protein [Hoyosella sp. YIM 151337]
MRALLDLLLPVECGGCSASGAIFCGTCCGSFAESPRLLRPRRECGVPVWTLASYEGAARELVVNLKERGRADLVPVAGYFLARGIFALCTQGDVDDPRLAPLVLAPAPSRWLAARGRGGDPVRAVARAGARALARRLAPPGTAVSSPDVTACSLLRFAPGVRDSVGLSAAQRWRNVAGKVRVRERVGELPAAVLIVDDVITTGALVSESVRALHAAGVHVWGAVTLAAA